MNFLSVKLADGRVFRMLLVIEVYSRECLALETDTSIDGRRVARALDRLKEERVVPEFSVPTTARSSAAGI